MRGCVILQEKNIQNHDRYKVTIRFIVCAIYNKHMKMASVKLVCTLAAIVCTTVGAPNLQAAPPRDLLIAAHRGDAVAMRRVGYMQFNGGERKNGFAWLKKAADKGDAQALYHIGCIYEQGSYGEKDPEKAKKYLTAAANKGSSAAKKRLQKMREGMVDDEVRTKAASSSSVITSVVKDIVKKCAKEGVSSVSTVAFLCNGRPTKPLSTVMRDKMLEKLVETKNLAVFDRLDTKMIAQEQSLSFDGAPPDPASAVLMGEVFFKPGDNYGYFAYRVFKTVDMKVISAGCERVKWSSKEMEMIAPEGSSSTLSFIPEAELENLSSKIKSLNVGIAMVQDRSKQSSNMIDSRLAYSQIVVALLKSGNVLYEREFMMQAMEESLLTSPMLEPGRSIEAIGYVQYNGSNAGENLLKVQVSACPGGQVLSTVNLMQKKGYKF